MSNFIEYCYDKYGEYMQIVSNSYNEPKIIRNEKSYNEPPLIGYRNLFFFIKIESDLIVYHWKDSGCVKEDDLNWVMYNKKDLTRNENLNEYYNLNYLYTKGKFLEGNKDTVLSIFKESKMYYYNRRDELLTLEIDNFKLTLTSNLIFLLETKDDIYQMFYQGFCLFAIDEDNE